MPKAKHQSIRLCVAIKENLSKYPESKILRELIQNSEDAGADKVIIKFDRNEYHSDVLLKDQDGNEFEKSRELQGPSLLIYNNSEFGKKDWEGIENFGIGSKKKDLKSYGQFGLGFNSCYHVSNKPQIVSGKNIWFLDPLNEIGGGLFYNFLNQEDSDRCKGHFEPFQNFEGANCDMKSNFKGTIIRLPLRVKSCEIKKKILSSRDIINVLEEFIAEVQEIPIFLKRIASITVMIDDETIADVKVTNNNEIKVQREKVNKFLETIIDKEMGDDKSDISEFTNLLNRKNQSESQSIYKMDLEISLKDKETKSISYVVSQGIFIDKSLIEMVQDTEVKLISYGGAAVPIIGNGFDTNIVGEQFKGKPFTFLPIGSLVYDLPLHVNGYFQLSDARNEIKYSSTTSRKTSQEFLSQQRNHFITQKIIPYFYLQALEFMKSIKSKNGLYNYFPFKKNQPNYLNSSPDVDISVKTMEMIVDGKYFQHMFHPDIYLSLSDSIIVENDTPDFVLNILNERNYNIINLPSFISQNLSNTFSNKLKKFSKPLLCSILKSHPLSEYSESVLDYLCDVITISNGNLSGINLIPIVHSSNQGLSFLLNQNDSFYTVPNKFTYMSDQIFNLLNHFSPNYKFVLKFSNLPNNFRRNIDYITNKYTNIKKIDLNQFIQFLKSNVSNSNIFDSIEIMIWECLDGLTTINNSLSIELISTIPIIRFRNHKNTYSFASYQSSNLLKYDSRFLSIEPILNKLDIFLIKENHKSNSLLANKNSISILLDYLQKIRINNYLNSIEIEHLRDFLILQIASYGGNRDHCSAFYSLPIHKCIGNHKSKYTSINSSSTCVVYSQIDQYELNGIGLVIIPQLDYHMFTNLPTSKVYYTEESVFRNYLIKNISKFDINKSVTIIQNFMSHIPKLINIYNDTDLLTGSWIPSINGIYSSPNNYYRLTELERNLLIQIQPNKIIHESLKSCIEYLKPFGLNQKLPKEQLFSQIPLKLSNTPVDENYEFIYSNYLKYLKTIEVSTHDINSISNIKFIPVSKVQTYNGFKPLGSKISLKESSLLDDKDISFTCKSPIADIDSKSPLHQYLSNESIGSVIDHWQNLNRLNFKDIEIDPKILFSSFYKRINQFIKNNSIGKEHLSKINVIWSNNQFVHVDKLLYTSNIGAPNFEPYFYKVDPGYLGSQFSNLFETMNVKKELNDEDYLNLIYSIQKQTNPIPLHELNLYVKSICSIRSICLFDKKIKLPTKNNEIYEFDRVYYKNCHDVPPDLQNIHLLHGDISESIVSRHKIYLISQKIQDSVAFEDSGENQFGQSEDLVYRLQSILKDYRPEIVVGEILMMQKQTRYLLENPTSNGRCIDFPVYLDSSLLFYNNAIFKENDIINVQKLSGSYKGLDTSCIGQFGLGINSVYHFSDCPSILTGKWLLIFDPLISHLEASTKRSTGGKYLISNHKSHPHLFKPFEHLQKIFNFKLEDGNFNGTITRLPLRKKLNGDRFISKNDWNDSSIIKYLNDIKSNNVENLMFFTNIESIEISVLEKNSSNVNSILNLSKKSSLSLVSQPYADLLLKIPIQVSEYKFLKEDFGTGSKIVTEERYIVGQSIDNPNIANSQKYPNNLAYKFLKMYPGNGKRKPVGGVAFKLTSDSNNRKDFTSKSFCWLPLKDLISNIPVHIHGCFSITTAREIVDTFRAMKSEINDPLSNALSNSDQQTESFLIYWNKLLVTEIILPIYINTLLLFKYNYIITNEDNKESIKKYYSFYYSLFPQKDRKSMVQINEKGCLQVLVDEFYRIIKNNSINLFIPCPLYENQFINSNTYYTDISFMDHQSVLKCISLLRFNINVVPINDFLNNFDIESKINLWINQDSFSTIIKNKELDQSVITVDDICNLFEYFKGGNQDLLNGCQLLVFSDNSRDFINIKSKSKDVQLFNEKHRDLIIENQEFKFLHPDLSKKIKNINQKEWFEMIKIYDLNYVQFYFNQLLPYFMKFSYENNVKNLEILGTYLTIKPNTFNEIKHSLFDEDQIDLLKKSAIFPFTNDKGVKEFSTISKLYSLENFKSFGFKLNYPDQDVNKWKHIHIFLGIKTMFDENDLLNQFKIVSAQCYTNVLNETDQQILIKKARYLWNSPHTDIIFAHLFELNIVPHKESKIFGHKRKIEGSVCLSKIKDTISSRYENLYFSNRYIVDELNINYPSDHIYNYDLIFDNLINLLSNVSSWHLINEILNPQIFSLLDEICSVLNGNRSEFSQDQKNKLLETPGIPVQGSNGKFISFKNMVLSSSISNLHPYFNILPNFYSQNYQPLFKKLGVLELNSASIINRLKDFIHTAFTNVQEPLLSHLYGIIVNNLNNLNNNIFSDIPIMTKAGHIKPSNQVFLYDNLAIGHKIKQGNNIYEIHSSLVKDYKKLGIKMLSSVITEELIGIEEVNQPMDSRFDLFENLDFISFVNDLGIGEILKTTIKFGSVKTKLIYNGDDVTGKPESISFYKDNVLYIDYKQSKKDVINALCFNVIGNRDLSLKLENFIDSLNIINNNNYNNNNHQVQLFNGTDVNSNLVYYRDISKNNFDSANCLLDNGFYNNACSLYYVSIEMSLKYLLEKSKINSIGFRSIYELKGRLNNRNLPTITKEMENYKSLNYSNVSIGEQAANSFKNIATLCFNQIN